MASLILGVFFGFFFHHSYVISVSRIKDVENLRTEIEQNKSRGADTKADNAEIEAVSFLDDFTSDFHTLCLERSHVLQVCSRLASHLFK